MSASFNPERVGSAQGSMPTPVLEKRRVATDDTKWKVWNTFHEVSKALAADPSMKGKPVSAWVSGGLEHLAMSWEGCTNRDLYESFSGTARHFSYFFGPRGPASTTPNPHALRAATYGNVLQLDKMFTAMI